MKKLIYIIILIVCTYIGFWCGQQTWILDANYKVHHFNTEEARNCEVKYCNAVINGLHWYYQRDKQLWKDSFMITNEYNQINVANDGDWEDFYTDW